MGTSVEGCPDGEKTEDELIVPDGYLFLPGELFRVAGIPPPLVSETWYNYMNSNEEAKEDPREDTVPLAKLKAIIKKRRKFRKLPPLIPLSAAEKPGKVKEMLKKEKCPLINKYVTRRRGRPRKKVEKETSTEEILFNEDPFWDSDDDDSSNFDDLVPRQDHLEESIKEGERSTNNTNKNEKLLVGEKLPEEKEKRKKTKTEALGVKTDDSKIIFPCSECGKSFSAASTLKSHKRIHNGTLLTCSECHKGFVSKYLLKCHMRIHNGDLFMCHKCGRGFITAELLKIHNRTHTGHKPFVCPLCGKSFPTSSNMVQHKQTHNVEKKFLCSQCGSSFAQKRCLDYHMIAHSEKKNICNVCGKLWARKNDLIEHMRVHTGLKPYSCSQCPLKFSQASSLKRHQIVHTNVDVDKRISCNACHKTFKCQVYYTRHLKKHAQKH